jgi:sulfatase maturation enzyme AslB (radical SAM superfamily)
MRVGLGLSLTGRCNLVCAYCYQSSGASLGPLSWNAVRAAVAAAVALEPEGVDVVFSGGEPLLERDLLTRCIAELDDLVSTDVELSIRLITNGTLLDRRLTELLARRGVDLQLSLHESPGRRGFSSAYELLSDLIDAYPDYSRSHVSTATVVPSWRVPGLARHVHTLIEFGVEEIHFAVPFTPDPGWTAETDAELKCQLETILEQSANYWQERGTIPVACLRPQDQTYTVSDDCPGKAICRAGSGTMFAVDPTGRAWACPCFAPTLHTLPPLAAAAARVLDLGAVESTALLDRLASLPSVVRGLRSFIDRRSKHTRSRKCAECPELGECAVCPAAICHCEDDPQRIPDHQCAFERITLATRRRLAERIGADEPALENQRRARLLEELKSELAADRRRSERALQT